MARLVHGSSGLLLLGAIGGGRTTVQAVIRLEELKCAVGQRFDGSVLLDLRPDSNDASVSEAETLKPSEALDRYLAGRRNDQPARSDSLFGVQADASLPAREHAGDR